MPIPDGAVAVARVPYHGGPMVHKTVTVCGQNATHYDVMTEDGEHFAVPWRELEAMNPDVAQGPP
jgi:hypothetical protein